MSVMNNRPMLLCIGSILIIVAVLAATFISAPVQARDTSTSNPNSNSQIDYTAILRFQKGGSDVIDLPFSFTYQEMEVDTLSLTLSYLATGEDIDWSTLLITVNLELWWDYQVAVALDTDVQSSTAQEDSMFWSWTLTTILNPNDNPYLIWDLYADLDIFASVCDIWNEPHTDESTLSMGCRIEYSGVSFGVSSTLEPVAGIDPQDPSYLASSAIGGSVNPVENPAMGLLIVGVIAIIFQLMSSRKR